MGSGFAKMKKQARVMEEQLGKMRDELKTKEFTGSSGNGLVTVILSGEGQLKTLKIKPECVDPSDVEGLQDLIISAFTTAKTQLDEESNANALPFSGALPF